MIIESISSSAILFGDYLSWLRILRTFNMWVFMMIFNLQISSYRRGRKHVCLEHGNRFSMKTDSCYWGRECAVHVIRVKSHPNSVMPCGEIQNVYACRSFILFAIIQSTRRRGMVWLLAMCILGCSESSHIKRSYRTPFMFVYIYVIPLHIDRPSIWNIRKAISKEIFFVSRAKFLINL